MLDIIVQLCYHSHQNKTKTTAFFRKGGKNMLIESLIRCTGEGCHRRVEERYSFVPDFTQEEVLPDPKDLEKYALCSICASRKARYSGERFFLIEVMRGALVAETKRRKVEAGRIQSILPKVAIKTTDRHGHRLVGIVAQNQVHKGLLEVISNQSKAKAEKAKARAKRKADEETARKSKMRRGQELRALAISA